MHKSYFKTCFLIYLFVGFKEVPFLVQYPGHTHPSPPLQQHSPFQVVFLLREARPCQRGRCFGQKAHKIVAEVEGASALVSPKPAALQQQDTRM